MSALEDLLEAKRRHMHIRQTVRADRAGLSPLLKKREEGTLNTHDIKHLAVETIYLVPDSSEGQRCYLWCDDPAPGLDADPSEAVEYLRKDVHEAIIAKQANAAKQGMDAAKKVAGSNLEQAKRLHAESNPQALESERAANAALTELAAKLEQERDALAAHVSRITGLCRDLDECEQDSEEMGAVWDKLESALQDAPTTSLARRDGLKEAEAVEQWADCLESVIRHVESEHAKDPNYPAIGAEGMGEFAADMRTEAEKLRKKTEGHQ